MFDQTKIRSKLSVGNLLHLSLIVAIVIVLQFNFFPKEPDPDSARYMLSALVQSEAAIIAIVVTLSLVAIQLAASSYSPTIIGIYQKYPYFWLFIFFYLGNIIYGLYILNQIKSYEQPPLIFIGVYMTDQMKNSDQFNLWTHLTLAYRLGVIAFLALIPYTWNILELFKPSTLLRKFSRDITKISILAQNYDPFQSVMGIITSSMMRYDKGTVNIGLATIKERIILIFTNGFDSPEEQQQFSNNFLPYLSEIGYLAASRGDMAAVKQIANAIEQMGLAATELCLGEIAAKITETLGAIGGWCAKNHLDFSVYSIVESLINIEIKAVERKLGVTAIQAALELNSIGTILQEQGQEGVILFNLIGDTIKNKIIFNVQIQAEQKKLIGAELEKAVSQGDSMALINISMSYRIFGYIREADSTKEMAFKLQNADTWYNQGWILSQQGEYEKAIIALNKAIELNPDLAEAWNNKGISLNNLNKSEEAIRAFERAIEINPQNTETWNNKGNALKKLGNYDDAIIAYDSAIKINPQNAMAWFNKGTILFERGENDKAINAFNQAININPRYSKAFINRGNALHKLQKIDDAIDSFDRAIDIDPQLAEAWNGKGLALRSQGEYDEAIKAFDKAIELKSDFAEVWCNKGLTLDELGKHDEAIQAYNKVIELNPSIWQAWVAKGLALKSLGRTAESDAAFAKAKELGYEK